MIEHLAALVETFPGAANRTRCFAHILNLVAKSVLRQFEGPKKGKAADDAAKELAADVDEMDVDNNEASDGGSNKGGNDCEDGDDDVVDDNEDGLLDEDEMSMEDRAHHKLTCESTWIRPAGILLLKTLTRIRMANFPRVIRLNRSGTCKMTDHLRLTDNQLITGLSHNILKFIRW